MRGRPIGDFPSRKRPAPADIADFQSALEIIMLDGTGPSQVAKEAPNNRCTVTSHRWFAGYSFITACFLTIIAAGRRAPQRLPATAQENLPPGQASDLHLKLKAL
jgi:hypothetical protein